MALKLGKMGNTKAFGGVMLDMGRGNLSSLMALFTVECLKKGKSMDLEY